MKLTKKFQILKEKNSQQKSPKISSKNSQILFIKVLKTIRKIEFYSLCASIMIVIRSKQRPWIDHNERILVIRCPQIVRNFFRDLRETLLKENFVLLQDEKLSLNAQLLWHQKKKYNFY